MRRFALVVVLAGCRVEPSATSPSSSPAEAVRIVEVDRARPSRGGVTLDRVTAISVGPSHACALREDHSVWCWGGNGTGALGRDDVSSSLVARRVTPLPPASRLAAGDGRTCVIDGGGDVWCWGSNFRGEADADRGRTDVPSWVSLAWCGVGDSDLDQDNMRFSPQRVEGVRGATDLALGADHTCAATAEGVTCWGSAERGAVGEHHDAGFQMVRVPLPASPVALVAGTTHTCAVDGHGESWCWGDEQIGDSGILAPHRVGGLPRGRELAIVGGQTCLLAEDDTTWCWGGEPPDEYADPADPWDRYRPTPEVVALPVPWSRFIHVNGFPCSIDDRGGVDCTETFIEPRAVPVVGLDAPVVALSGALSVCSLSEAGTVHCFSAYEDRVMVSDWAGTSGRATPIMVRLDPDAAPVLPEGAVVRPEALPPAEARVCVGTAGRCTHRLGVIDCMCEDGTAYGRVDPAGVAWFDDEDCFVELAAACGPGPSEAVGVSCHDERGRCDLLVGPAAVVSCGCADGDAVATTGEDDWTGQGDAALVGVCRARLATECG